MEQFQECQVISSRLLNPPINVELSIINPNGSSEISKYDFMEYLENWARDCRCNRIDLMGKWIKYIMDKFNITKIEYSHDQRSGIIRFTYEFYLFQIA